MHNECLLCYVYRSSKYCIQKYVYFNCNNTQNNSDDVNFTKNIMIIFFVYVSTSCDLENESTVIYYVEI